jgi:amidase
MTELAFESATTLAAAIRAKEISSRELLDLHLARVETHNPRVNAVVTIDEEGARARAKEADEALAGGQIWGPLHGLPMTLKDAFETAGMRTTGGTPEHADHIPTVDADVTARVRAAGAVIFGKTNMPVNGVDWQSFNPVFGCTNNPWDLGRTPGGSSGGSSAALAAGLTAFEVGSDLAGSIRWPAHCCGVYGLKASYRIISPRGHVPPAPGTLAPMDLAVMGPMGRSADDLDLGLDVLAGPDTIGAAAWRLELPPPRVRALRDHRVAVWMDDQFCPVDDEVLAVLHAAVEAIRGAGASVDEKARPVEMSESAPLYDALLMALGGSMTGDEEFAAMAGLAEGAPADDTSDAVVMARGITQRVRDWHRLDEQRQRVRAAWAAFFEDFDVLLCPVAPTAAFPHDHNPDQSARRITVNGEPRPYFDTVVPWAGLLTMPYLPSVAAPVGRTPGGLPVGVQVVAPYLHDRVAVQFARELAGLIGGFVPPPGY